MPSTAAYSQIDPDLDTIFKKHGKPLPFLPDKNRMPHLRALSAASTRRLMANPFVEQTLESLPNRDFQQLDKAIPVRNGEINIRIYRPLSSFSCGQPVVVMAHGGGWCLGGLDTEAFTCQLLSRSLDPVVVDVEYRLCPEVRYPSPVLDVYDAVKWVAANSASIGGDLSKGFILCGVSGGGNLTTGATYLARDEKLQPPLTGSILICTGMLHKGRDNFGNHIDLLPGKFPSWDEHADAPICSQKTNECYGDLANIDITSPLLTPLHSQDHSRLPPLYYQVAGIDPWRDSALIYAEMLEQAGVKTMVDVFPGVPHCWWSFDPQLSINRKWAKDTINGATWLLQLVNPNRLQLKL